MSGFTVIEGDRRHDYTWSSDLVLERRSQSLNEDAVMLQNARIRSAGGARALSWCQPLFSLSPDQYEFLCRLKPALRSKDKKEQKEAWLRLARDVDFYKLGLKDR